MSFRSLLSAAVLSGMFAASASATPLVANGDFESGSLAFQNGTWGVFQTLDGGWERVSGSGIEVQTNGTLGSIDSHNGGNRYVELDSHDNSAMRQLINFTSAGRYLLTFFYSPRDNRTASNVIEYSIAGESGSVTGPQSVDPVTAVGTWTEITMEFVITQADIIAGGQYLNFAAAGTDNSFGGFVDSVSIVAVPLPAGGLLLLTALGGAALLRRRKAAV